MPPFLFMRGNPEVFPRTAREPYAVPRCAPSLLSFRYIVWTCLSSHSSRRLGGGEDKVAAGVNPAAKAMLIS